MPLVPVIVAAVLGFLFLRKRSSANAPIPGRMSEPAPVLTTSPLITDPATIQGAQTLVNQYASKLSLSPGPVNGQANDPTFVANLASMQRVLNAKGNFQQAGLPFASIRTDGALDQDTWLAISTMATEDTLGPTSIAPVVPNTTALVTNSRNVMVAQAMVNTIATDIFKSVPWKSTRVDGNAASPQFVEDLAMIQKHINGIQKPGLPVLRTDGVLDGITYNILSRA